MLKCLKISTILCIIFSLTLLHYLIFYKLWVLILNNNRKVTFWVTNIHALRDSSVNSWNTKCLMTFLQKCTFHCATLNTACLCFLNDQSYQSYLITASTVNFLHYQLNIKTYLKLATALINQATVLQSYLSVLQPHNKSVIMNFAAL